LRVAVENIFEDIRSVKRSLNDGLKIGVESLERLNYFLG
jgi:hypothetical protein